MTVDLSVIIVNYACWDHLKRCLLSLEYLHDSTAPGCEIVVVDNASPNDRLDEFDILFPQVRFVRNTGNHGFAHGCNTGARHAKGQTLLFLNPDCQDPDRCVQGLWERFGAADAPAQIVSCRQIDGHDRLQKAFGPFPTLVSGSGPGRALLRLLQPARYPRPTDIRQGWQLVDWVSGSVLMISASDLNQLNGWCDRYWMYSEDVDLCRRAHQAGLRAAYTADVTLVHHHGGASRRNAATRGLTRAETAISRHLYASRHLPPISRGLTHVGIFLFRYLTKTPARIWHLISRVKTSQSISFSHLSSYYLGVLSTRRWDSPRAVGRPDPHEPAGQ